MPRTSGDYRSIYLACAARYDRWNHVILSAHCGANYEVTYESVAVDGVVYPINVTVPEKKVPEGWWVDFQLPDERHYKIEAITADVNKQGHFL